MTSTVSVTIAVTRMICEVRHSFGVEQPARRRVLVAHVSPPRDRPALSVRQSVSLSGAGAAVTRRFRTVGL